MHSKYCAISAKLKAMHSGCLYLKDYENFMTKKDVVEACEFLKNETSYTDVFKNLESTEVHRGNIEKILNYKLFNEYIRLYNFMERSQRSIFRFWMVRNEVEFLKRRLRHIFNHEKTSGVMQSNDYNNFFNQHTKIDSLAAIKTDNLEGLLAACINTPYYDVLKTAIAINSDYFSIVMMLDRLYYVEIWKAKNKLPKKEADIFAEFIGTRVDMLNIMWIYRGKKYFNFDNEIIYTYLIPIKYSLDENTIKKMVESENPIGIIEVVSETKYNSLFRDIDDGFYIEDNSARLQEKISQKIFVNHPASMAAVFSYFELKRIEIQNITTIIEGIRYKTDMNMIKKHLITSDQTNVVG